MSEAAIYREACATALSEANACHRYVEELEELASYSSDTSGDRDCEIAALSTAAAIGYENAALNATVARCHEDREWCLASQKA